MEMPMMPAMQMQPTTDYCWYPSMEAAWGNIDTPQKNPMMGMDCQFMPMETPPDAFMKQMMPGNAMFQQMCDESALKAEGYDLGMPMGLESAMLPHRLFDSPPEKSEQGLQHESNSSNGDSPTTGESGDSPQSRDLVAPMSPRARVPNEDSLGPLMSPSPGSFIRADDKWALATPTPTTPKRPCYVPETPSPDRMHCSWMQPAMPYGQPAPQIGGMPWTYGAPVQAHEQVFQDFLQMMPMHHEGQAFGDVAL
jgi:hypothetical protein